MKVRTRYNGATDTSGSSITVRVDGKTRKIPYNLAARDADTAAIERVTGVPAVLAVDTTTYTQGNPSPLSKTWDVPDQAPRVWADGHGRWHVEIQTVDTYTPGTYYGPTRYQVQKLARDLMVREILERDAKADPAAIVAVWDAPGTGVPEGGFILCRFIEGERNESLFKHDGQVVDVDEMRDRKPRAEYDPEHDRFTHLGRPWSRVWPGSEA